MRKCPQSVSLFKSDVDCLLQVRVQAGSRAVLDCGAGGDEPLEFQWNKNRTKLERQESRRLVVRIIKIKMVMIDNDKDKDGDN